VILHALSHVAPLRYFYLMPSHYALAARRSALVQHFGEVLRKLWSRYVADGCLHMFAYVCINWYWAVWLFRDNFKSVISPQDLMQTISTESKRRFNIGQQAEAIDLFVWLCNELSKALQASTQNPLDGSAKPPAATASNTIIQSCFQGEVEVRTWTKPKKQTATAPSGDDSGAAPANKPVAKKVGKHTQQSSVRTVTDPLTGELWEETITTSPFSYLSIDIPPTPLFRDSQVKHTHA
jgi:U4/U6.U5 tri-snRNP-associated protein 2